MIRIIIKNAWISCPHKYYRKLEAAKDNPEKCAKLFREMSDGKFNAESVTILHFMSGTINLDLVLLAETFRAITDTVPLFLKVPHFLDQGENAKRKLTIEKWGSIGEACTVHPSHEEQLEINKANMAKKPKRIRELYHIKGGKKIVGAPKKLKGITDGIYGDATRLTGFLTDDLEGDVSRIIGDVSNIYGYVDDLLGDVSNISGRVMDLRGDASEVKGDVKYIHGNLSGICGDVSKITGCVDHIYGDVSNIRGNVTDIEGNMGGVKGKVQFVAKFAVLPKIDVNFGVTAFLVDNNLYFSTDGKTYEEDAFLDCYEDQEDFSKDVKTQCKVYRKLVKMAHKIVKQLRLDDPKTN